jgi:hypothetical protein
MAGGLELYLVALLKTGKVVVQRQVTEHITALPKLCTALRETYARTHSRNEKTTFASMFDVPIKTVKECACVNTCDTSVETPFMLSY